jgi:hypothetical protein
VTLRRPSRDRRNLLPALAVGWLIFGLAAARLATAAVSTLSFAPAVPTWHDVVVARIVGTATSSCGPAAGPVRARVTQIREAQRHVDVALEQPCLLPSLPPTGPFTVELELGHLVPGRWTVEITDFDGDSSGALLDVHDLGTIDVDFPEPVLAGVPFTARVRGVAQCFIGQPTLTTPAPGVIEIVDGGECLPILNPPGGPFDHTVQVPGLPAGDYEVRAFDRGDPPLAVRVTHLRVWSPTGCVPSDSALCLQHGRFRVGASWRDFSGSQGTAHAAPAPEGEGSGLLWFFTPDNAELTVKVLDGCALNQRWWVFLASASTVQYEVAVTDTVTGIVRRYVNPLGGRPLLIPDTDAFPACGAP